MPAASPIRSDAAATRLRILRAAEALFSENGVDGVSLQEIGRAAEQRHRSAVRYHFEDREGLLRAILARHAEPIAALRSRAIDAIEADGAQSDLHRVAEAWVLPVVEEAENPDGGMHFVRISAELIGHPSWSSFYFSRVDDLVATRRLLDLVTRAGPGVPTDQRRPRTIASTGFLFHAVADWSNASARLAEAKRVREWRALKRYLVEATAALWSVLPPRGGATAKSDDPRATSRGCKGARPTIGSREGGRAVEGRGRGDAWRRPPTPPPQTPEPGRRLVLERGGPEAAA